MTAPEPTGTPADLPPLVETIRRFEGIPAELVRLTTHEAAAALGLQAKTLEGWRVAGRGPAFCKIGRAVTYRLADLLSFMEGARYTTTREAKTARRLGRAAA
jgi:hypothetical protein